MYSIDIKLTMWSSGARARRARAACAPSWCRPRRTRTVDLRHLNTHVFFNNN